MGCCPSDNANQISPGYIKRRDQKCNKYNGRTYQDKEKAEKVKKSNIPKTSDDESLLKQIISQHFLLYRLPPHERDKMVEYLEIYECEQNVQIFSKGDNASLFFIIRSGKVEIATNPELNQGLHVKTKGEYFGDLALIYAAARSASVRSLTPCTFYCISHQLFRRFVQDIVKRNYEQSKQLIECIPLFRFLSRRQKNTIAYSTLLLKFEPDEKIFDAGDDANCLYIIKSGKIKLQIPGKSSLVMSSGESFGENAFEEKQVRSGAAIALEKSLLLSIGRDNLRRCLGYQLIQITFYNILKWSFTRDELFQRATKLQIQKLIRICQIRKYRGDDIICEAGSICTFMVVVLEERVNEQPTGTIFNHEYLLARDENQQKMTKSLIKVGSGRIAIVHFQDIMHIFGKNMALIQSQLPSKNAIMDISIRRNKQYIDQITLEDFIIRAKLGDGQFSKVYLVEGKYGKSYALKCIQKNKIIQNKMEKFICTEKQILAMVSSQFVVRLYKTFKDEHFIYFLMSYLDGVNFFDFLRQIGLCNKTKAQFFTGCLVLALEHLHDSNIIYRDLKPENIVVDETGYLNIVDLGIGKLLGEDNGYRTFTIVGTPHYMAPEIVTMQGYTFSADLWSLGIILYEMMCGSLPFGNSIDDPYEIFKEIDSKQPQFPVFIQDPSCKTLINKLLSKDPSDRFVQDFSKLKNMGFYEEFDWQKLAKKSIGAPVKVKTKSKKKKIDEPFKKYIMKEKANYGKPLKSQENPKWDKIF